MFRFASSVVLRGGRGAADRYRCVWVALTVFRPHWVCPRSRVCVLSPSTLLRLPAALYGACHALRAVPVFGFSTKAQTWLGLRFVPYLPEQLRQPGASRAHSPQVRCAFSSPWSQPQFPRTSWVRARCVCSWELASSRDLPGGCRPSRISGSLWLETVGLFAVW